MFENLLWCCSTYILYMYVIKRWEVQGFTVNDFGYLLYQECHEQ